jgi:hypothetical protein
MVDKVEDIPEVTVEELLTSLSPHLSIIVPLFLLAMAVPTTVKFLAHGFCICPSKDLN